MGQEFLTSFGPFVGVVFAAQVFMGGWIGCTVTFDPRIGFCLGWLPSGLFAYASYFVACKYWPLFAAAQALGALALTAIVVAPAYLRLPRARRREAMPVVLPAHDGLIPVPEALTCSPSEPLAG
jgi:hypothetical protein